MEAKRELKMSGGPPNTLPALRLERARSRAFPVNRHAVFAESRPATRLAAIKALSAVFVALIASSLAQGATPTASALPTGLGWHELPGTKLRPWCPSDTVYPNLHGGTGCYAVTAYSGGVFDAVNNRLLINGGGHHDWGGNEVYELDLDTVQMRRMNEPSYPVRDGCANNSVYADGKPVARHTYNHLAYLPNTNEMLLYGGSRWECGGFGQDTWTFNPTNFQWTLHPSPVTPRATFAIGMVRDPVSGLIYARDENNLYSLDPTTMGWSKRSADSDISVDAYKGAVIHPGLHRYYFYVANGVGAGRTLHSYDIGATSGMLARQSVAAPTCEFMDHDAIGWNYDADLDRLVAWYGTNTVFLLDPATATCTTRTIPGGPVALPWVYGRFGYSPLSHVHVSCNSIDDSCYILRLTDDGRIFGDGFEN